MISEPTIEYREEKLSMGIRTVAPFRGMFAVVDTLLKELRLWVKQQGIADQGPFFLRYHVIDMDGPMDIEVGFMVPAHLPGNGRVKPGVLPAGYYANLTYTGSGMAGNKALIGWAQANGIAWDHWNEAAGDAFRCRYEAYLTDYRLEHRKARWEIDLAIRIADEQPQAADLLRSLRDGTTR
jgi:effector-binding domain-containing protein